MSGSVNKVILIGNVGKNPEVRYTQDGKPIVNLSIATNEAWRDKASGERKEKTEWHRVVIFNEGIAKVADQYVKKGTSLYIEGQLQTRKWTDKDGVEKYTTEIVLQNFGATMTLLGSKQEDEAKQADDYQRPLSSDAKSGRASFEHDLDDEVPF